MTKCFTNVWLLHQRLLCSLPLDVMLMICLSELQVLLLKGLDSDVASAEPANPLRKCYR